MKRMEDNMKEKIVKGLGEALANTVKFKSIAGSAMSICNHPEYLPPQSTQ
jgi:hypothetical protein